MYSHRYKHLYQSLSQYKHGLSRCSAPNCLRNIDFNTKASCPHLSGATRQRGKQHWWYVGGSQVSCKVVENQFRQLSNMNWAQARVGLLP